MARFTLRVPQSARALHRAEGLGRARRRLADRERGRRRHLLGADHPAHARRHDLGALQAGDPLNLEVDLMARYAARLIETTLAHLRPPPSRLLLTVAATENCNGTGAPADAARETASRARASSWSRRATTTTSPTCCCAARSACSRKPARASNVVTVPGALEIPAAIVIALEARRRASSPMTASVALGCVIRGETSHYDIVAGESARGLMDSRSRATCRSATASSPSTTMRRRGRARGRPASDKGGGAARAALALVRLKRKLVAGKRGA